ncbi:hypothetical protein FRB94_008754 [Tulasnella sp. JGI-2019a]|nr:hypothetical protein FRB94_008754 [Tulasnella sp. JGI-2019a]
MVVGELIVRFIYPLPGGYQRFVFQLLGIPPNSHRYTPYRSTQSRYFGRTTTGPPTKVVTTALPTNPSPIKQP